MCLFGCVCAVSSFWYVQPPAADQKNQREKQAWKIILVVFRKFSRLLALVSSQTACAFWLLKSTTTMLLATEEYTENVCVYITIHINKDKRLPFNHCEWCGWRGPGDNEQKYNKLGNVYGLMHYSLSLSLATHALARLAYEESSASSNTVSYYIERSLCSFLLLLFFFVLFFLFHSFFVTTSN